MQPAQLPMGRRAALLGAACALLLTGDAKWTQDELAISFFLDPPPTLAAYQLVAAANFTVMLGTSLFSVSVTQLPLCFSAFTRGFTHKL